MLSTQNKESEEWLKMKIRFDSDVIQRYFKLSNEDEKETEKLINKVLSDWLKLSPAMHKGKESEDLIREILHNNREELNIRSIAQYDVVVETNDGEFVMVECKRQEYFKAPPFDGHGLPKWQVEKYLRQQEKGGMRVLLLIDDPDKECYYKQWLDKLEASGNIFDTKGRSPRRVYNLEEYDSLEYSDDPTEFVEWFKETLKPELVIEKLKKMFGESEQFEADYKDGTYDDEVPF